MHDFSQDANTIRRTVRDLVALTALPAVWAGCDQRRVAETLAESLLSILRLDFIYLQLRSRTTGAEMRVARGAHGPLTTEDASRIERAVATLRERAGSGEATRVANPIAPGALNVVLAAVNSDSEDGVLAAASDLLGFPSEEDRLLLTVGANQVAVVLQRQRAEEVLRQANVRLNLAVRGSNIGIWEIDMPDGVVRNGRVDFTNVWEQFGHDRPDAPTDFPTAMALVHPEDAGAVADTIEAFVAGDTHDLEFEHRIRRRDGSYSWMLTRGVAVRDAAGTPVRLIGSSIDITELKLTEEKLRRSESLLAEAQQIARVGSWNWDIGSDAVEWSDEHYRIFGVAPQERPVNYESFLSFIHPDDRAAVRDRVEQSLKLGRPYETFPRAVHRDGTLLYVHSRGHVEFDSAGKPVRMYGTIQDVTERRLAEDALRLANERLDLAMRGSNIGIWEVDMPDGDPRRGRVRHVNFWEHLGYEPEEFPKDVPAALDVGHPEDRERTERAVAAYLAGETPKLEIENRGRHKDGSYRWFLTRGVAVRDPAGKPVRLTGTVLDVTERKRQSLRQQALAEAAQKINASLSVARPPNATLQLMTDLAREIIGARLAVTGMTLNQDWSQSVVVVSTADDTEFAGWRDDDDRGSAAALYGLVRSTSRPVRLTRDEIAAHPVFRGLTGAESAPPRLRGWLAVPLVGGGQTLGLLQLTDKLEGDFTAEDEAIAVQLGAMATVAMENWGLYQKVQEADRRKDEFLANVSHEIRTPMNAILGMAELALDTPLDASQREYVATVKSSAEALMGVIDDLLDFSKIEAGKLGLDPAPFSLRALVSETVRTLAFRARKKGLELRCRIESDVPNELDGDAGRLRQVLLNLIGNAVKFTQEGGVGVRVAVHRDAPNGAAEERIAADRAQPARAPVELSFEVSDTGIGIAPDRQQKIFEAFEQADNSTTRRYGGTGLGLSIASRLVDLMGGRIMVDSEPGRGSTFRFMARFDHPRPHDTDPASVAPPAEETGVAGEPRPGGEAAPSARLYVLLAEDNEFNQQVIEHLLQRKGHVVRSVGDGRQALATLEREVFDLLLVDCHMPEMDGFQVSAALRRREQLTGDHLPVIALTARSMEGDRERCLAAGMDAYLPKPIRAADLYETINRLVGRGGTAGAVAGAADRSALLDAATLLAGCGSDPNLLEKMVRSFDTHARRQLALVADAIRRQDARGLREAAHKLRGLVSAFSAVGAKALADLEQAGAGADLSRAGDQYGAAAEVIEALSQTLRGVTIDSLKQQRVSDRPLPRPERRHPPAASPAPASRGKSRPPEPSR